MWFCLVFFCFRLHRLRLRNPRSDFVSTERIFREAAPAKAAQAKIEQEFSRRDKDLQDMAARMKSMSDKLDKDTADTDGIRPHQETA